MSIFPNIHNKMHYVSLHIFLAFITRCPRYFDCKLIIIHWNVSQEPTQLQYNGPRRGGMIIWNRRVQVLLIRWRIWPDKHSDLFICDWPFLFLCIPLFSTLVPSQITWFPLSDTHKSCAFPKCSSPTSHNVSHTPYIPLSKRWSSVHGSTWGVSHLDTRAKGILTALGGIWTRFSFFWILNLGPVSFCALCSSGIVEVDCDGLVVPG